MIRRSLVVLGSTALLSLSVSVQANDDACELDDLMTNTRVQMDKVAADAYQRTVHDPIDAAIEGAPTVKDAACLPMLDQMDTMMRMRIPSLGGMMGGLMTKVRDMACKMANDAISDVADKAKAGISDPTGIIRIEGGVTTGDGGVSYDRYDLSEVAEQAIVEELKKRGSSDVREMLNTLPNGVGDRAGSPNSGVKDEIRGAINGL